MTRFYHFLLSVLCLLNTPFTQAWLLPRSWRGSIPQPRDYASDDGDLPETWLNLLSDAINVFEPIGDSLASFLGVDIATTSDSATSDSASTTTPTTLDASAFTFVAPPEITAATTPVNDLATPTPAVTAAANAPIQTFSLRGKVNVVAYFGAPIDSGASLAQLDTLCRDPTYDVVMLSSLVNIFEPATRYPMVNIGAGCDYTNPLDTSIDGSPLPNCKALGAQVATCQALGKKVMLSLDVAAGEQGFASIADARAAAMELWHLFGRESADTSDVRPLGYVGNGEPISVDGFEFYLEEDALAGDYLGSNTEVFIDTLQNYYTLNETAPYSYLSVSVDTNSFEDLVFESLHYVDWVTIRYSDTDLPSEGNESGWLGALANILSSIVQVAGMSIPSTPTTTPTGAVTAEVSIALALETGTPFDAAISAPFTPPVAALFPGNTFVSAETDIPVPDFPLNIIKPNADTTFATVVSEIDTPTATDSAASPEATTDPASTPAPNPQRVRKRDIVVPLAYVGAHASLFDDQGELPGYLMEAVDGGTIRGFAVRGTAAELASDSVGQGIVRGMQK